MILSDEKRTSRKQTESIAPPEKRAPYESRLTIAERYDVYCKRQAGMSRGKLAAYYDVSETAIQKYEKRIEKKIKEEGLEKLRAEIDKAAAEAEKIRDEKSALKTSMDEFAKKARSILWVQEHGKDHPTYDLWQSLVRKMVDGGLSKSQAVIQASKGFLCLSELFIEYDTSRSDPDPSYCPVKTNGNVSKAEIACEDKEQTHRENLTWAIEAAGKFLRTKGQVPKVAPNNAAYFLFQQACDDPKDFLSRFTQVDMKAGDTGEEASLMMRTSDRSISEIDDMLETLGKKKERD